MADNLQSHKDLEVWKNSISFVTTVYEISSDFPSEEKFGLTSQLRRAALSIPLNIAEGAARRYSKEFLQFIRIAMGSASEVETLFIIAANLKFISNDQKEQLINEINSISRMLMALDKSIKNKLS